MNRLATLITGDRHVLEFACGTFVLLMMVGYFASIFPDAGYVTMYLNDVFGLMDATYRMLKGQIPSIDFSSLYGVSAYYPAVLGMHLGFEAVGGLAFGHFLTAASLLGLTILVAYRRLATLPTLFLLVLIFLLVLVPQLFGGYSSDLTYAIYYTRHGWAALSITLLFYLEPKTTSRKDAVMDIFALSLLLLYLFYLKIIFGLVALSFAAANAVISKYNRQVSLLALLSFAVVFFAVSILTPYNAAYLNEILTVFDRVAGEPASLTDSLRAVFDYLDVMLLALTALLVVYAIGPPRIYDGLFVLGCIVSALFIDMYSYAMPPGLPLMAMTFIVLGELARRAVRQSTAEEGNARSQAGQLAIFGIVLALFAEPMIRTSVAMYVQFNGIAKARAQGQDDLAGIFVPALEDTNGKLARSSNPTADEPRFLSYDLLTAAEYLPLVREGVELLKTVDLADRPVMSFEQTNPFPMILGLKPTAYGYPLFFAEDKSIRSYLERVVRANDGDDADSSAWGSVSTFFSDADYVMVPEQPHSPRHHRVVMATYGPHLSQAYRQIARSDNWLLYGKR